MSRWPEATHPWPELLASALVGTARRGGDAEVLLDAAAGHALRRRAGVALVPAAPSPAPAPVDEVLTVGPVAAARAELLLALDHAGRHATPVRDLASRRELLAEWLATAAAAGRRLPPELVPALLDAGRRHRQLRPLIAPVAGPLAGWLAGQRPEWSYAAAASAAEPAAAEPAPAGPATPPDGEPGAEPLQELAERAVAALRRGPGSGQATGAEPALAACPRPWPPPVVDAVLAALADQLGKPRTRSLATGLCELAALGLPAGTAPQVVALVERMSASERSSGARDAVGIDAVGITADRPGNRGLAAAERLVATIQFRHEMLEELARDQ